MSRNGQEVILEGWLTKSPPTKRVWRARWRRRWFSLHGSGELPGQYFLTYYTDRKCRKLKGTINLDHCEQVDTGLKFEDSNYKFEHMFDIKTPTRVYYLAAETEEEMKAWANCICGICGLKATSDDETGTRSLSLPTANYENQPILNHQNNDKSQVESPPVTPTSSGPYIPISECITGRLPSHGCQDFYDLLQHNIKNSYFRTGHTNATYETASPTYLNDCQLGNNPKFYDMPRKLQPTCRPQKNDKRESYYNLTKSDNNKKVNGSPLQSPTDSESVFTDDDWTHNTSLESNTKSINRSICSNVEVAERIGKLSVDDLVVDPPPRPPKPAFVASTPNYFNLAQVPQKASKESKANGKTEENQKPVLSDDMYDFPRSHQLENNNESACLTIRRHCYNNAAPVKIEGEIFRYDISPKPSTSSNEVFHNESGDAQDEPSSPATPNSANTMYSNLPSPVFSTDTQLMPPPQIYRSLKPKRKLSDSVSITSSNEPSSPRPAPSVDRSCKPLITAQSSGLRKKFENELEHSCRDTVYGNQQMFDDRSPKHGGGDLSRVQYLDLDHSPSNFNATPIKTQPSRSPGASTVYKKVDFEKTEAFNMTRQHLEMQRKEPVVTYKK